MPRYKGAHLTWNDRLTIGKMLREGYSKPQIARYLGVHHSTVYDECRRGAVELKRSDLTTEYLLLRRCRQGLPPGPQEEHGKAS